MTDFQIPSLYHFSAVDAASAVDYSLDVSIDDSVVNSPPRRVAARAYTPSPSPLSKEKQTLVQLGHVSFSSDDGVARHGPSGRLRMEAPRCDPSPADSVPPANLSAVISPPCPHSPSSSNKAAFQSAPDAPVDAPAVPIVPPTDVPKTKAAPRSLGGRPSLTSSLDRHALKAASSEPDRCLALRRSARHSFSQTPSYSTYNTTSYNSGARSDIWKNDTYSGPVYKHGYSRWPEIFRAMEATKNKDTAAKNK